MNKAIDYGKRCPDCGAPMANGLDCSGQLREIILWEDNDPKLRSQHFWTMACYCIQHPAGFKEETIAQLSGIFRNAYDRQQPLEAEIELVPGLTDQLSKMFEKKSPGLTCREWAMTISEVYLVGELKGAADRVLAWAKVVRKQM